MQSVLIVFLGAGLGGAMRHGVNLGAARLLGIAFPWGTLAVNVVGSFLMGVVVAWLAFRSEAGWNQPLRLFLTTGILGGFTTFSAFSLDTVLLWEREQALLAFGYVLVSVAVSIGALVAGLAAVRSLG